MFLWSKLVSKVDSGLQSTEWHFIVRHHQLETKRFSRDMNKKGTMPSSCEFSSSNYS